MKKYKTIAIERQYASGGREIGRILAQKLGIGFYNEEILNMATENLHISSDYGREYDESSPSAFMYGMAIAANTMDDNISISDRLFFEESKIIRELALGERCVIVGRCARHVLTGKPDCLNVFIYSDTKDRVKRAVNEYGIRPSEAEATLKKNDKRRANFYNIQADRKWDDKYAYDICLNSGFLGVENCVEIIASAYKGSVAACKK